MAEIIPETDTEPEEKPEFEKLEDKFALPKLTRAELDYLFTEISDVCQIYFMTSDRQVMNIPRERKYFLNEILKILKSYSVID